MLSPTKLKTTGVKKTRLPDAKEQIDPLELDAIEDELVGLEHQLSAESVSPTINLNDKWCVYLSVHPIGFYYYGKGITKNVVSGAYKGSGTSLRASWVWYPKDEWTAHPIETFSEQPLDENSKDPGEILAYAREKEIINFDMLCDPFCMNDVPGGKGGYTWGQVSSRAVEKRKKSIATSWDDPEIRERHRAGNISRWATPGAREKHREVIRHSWTIRRQSEEFLEQIEKTAVLKQQRALDEKTRKLTVASETKKKAAATISQKAIERGEKARLKKFEKFSPQFETWVATAVLTKSGVLDIKKTIAALNTKVPSSVVSYFTDWLDAKLILRWGGETHKQMLLEKVTDKEQAAENRRVELAAKAEKIYKMKDSSRDKMRETQLLHAKKECNFCGGEFRPACFGRYHGNKCKTHQSQGHSC